MRFAVGSFKLKLFLLVAFALLLVSLGSLAAVYSVAQARERAAMRERLATLAATAALAIDGDAFRELLAAGKPEHPAYLRIQRSLQQIKRANPGLRFVYTMERSNAHGIAGEVRFVVDLPAEDINGNGRIDTDEEMAVMGQAYLEGEKVPDLLTGFERPVADRRIIKDRWGPTLSGYAPIRDREGRSVGLVGLDMPATRIEEMAREFLRQCLLVVLGVVAAAALLAWIVAYRIERPIRALKSGIEAVRNGHKDVVVTVDASREFTDLVAAFNAMVQSQHELEAQLRQAAKMETIGHLASGIIHDFNNHLAVISGNLELIESSLADCHPAREYLDAAADATRIMANLATQLLTFSRRGLPQLAPTDVHQIIAPFLQVLQRTCKKGIRIETRLEASDRMVLGDAAQLTNALLNLAINARDAMPDGGMLTLATANIGEKAASSLSAGVRVSPRYLRIEVADTGKGMDEATRRRAFEPFFTTKEAEQGTGLGLASVLSTVTRHRGSIRVESAPDQGSRFIILLPLIDPVD